MAQIPGTGVFSLESAFGPSFPQNSGLETLELGGIQSCYAVSGSVAEALNLYQRRTRKARAQTVYEGPTSIHSSLSDFVNDTDVTATGVYAAGGSVGHVTADDGDRAFLDHGLSRARMIMYAKFRACSCIDRELGLEMPMTADWEQERTMNVRAFARLL